MLTQFPGPFADMSNQDLTLVIGGAASGKSAFAEQVVLNTQKPKVYLATAQAFDAEMLEKVKAHQVSRGSNWKTIEEPINIADVITARAADEILLIDCLTLWITNLLLNEIDLESSFAELLQALEAATCPIVIVSNEVGQGIVPDNALSRRFRAGQGRLNQLIASKSHTVVAVLAGLPVALKGTLPE